MGVTIKDIAKRTGLSITTVSLVLNKRESRISEKTKQIVENTAHELHYSPNQAAISLATKKTNVIGLIIPQGSCYRPNNLMISFERACRNAGYSLSCSFPEDDDDTCFEAVEAMISRGADGIIFDGSNVSGAFYASYRDLVLKTDIPMVTLTGSGADLLSDSIMPDHRRGACLAVSHLLSLGHSRTGCILGPRDSGIVSDMIRGCADAFGEFGLDPDSLPALFMSYDAEGGYRGIETLLKQGVTGVFAGSDAIAAGVFRRAYELGIAVPEKLSVVGYGDSPFAADNYVPLSTVNLHFDRIARKAVFSIKMPPAAEQTKGPELILPSLVVRASTARTAGTATPGV
jgi:LacI family transcriptional regulator